jgi:hypothetical protein
VGGSLPATTGALAAPSAPTVSAGDLLSTETELNYTIVTLQLLLQGALSDQLEPKTNSPRPRLTMGLPVSINVPPGFQYRNAVAEIEVSMCAPEGTGGIEPRLVTILPQARTYNVASLVSRSAQIGGGAVTQIFTAGGTLFRGRQTFYVVKDQDTIAFQHVPFGECKALVSEPAGLRPISYRPLVFGWQFKPVLGQAVVQDGLRQNFVQLSFSPTSQSPDPRSAETYSCESEPVRIRARWRRYDPKTGRVGAQIGRDKNLNPYTPPTYSEPVPQAVTVDDNGDGKLTVSVWGAFKTTAFVRIGNLVLGPTQGIAVAQTPAGPQNTPPANPNAASPTATNAPAPPPASGNSTAPSTAGSPNNSSPNQAGSPAPGASTANQSTLQIQGTVQITSGQQAAQQGTTSPAATTSNSFYWFPDLIRFTAPATAIAQNDAFLVNPDGYEGKIFRGASFTPVRTCEAVIADKESPANPRAANPAAAEPSQPGSGLEASDLIAGSPGGPADIGLSPNSPPQTSAATGNAPTQAPAAKPSQPGDRATQVQSHIYQQYQVQGLIKTTPLEKMAKDIVLTRFSDSMTRVTLSGIPDPPKNPSVPPVPVVLVGSTIFGLSNSPFAPPLDLSSGQVTVFVPTSLLSVPGQRIVFRYLFEDTPPAIYPIPAYASSGNTPVNPASPACVITSKTLNFLYTDGGKNNHYSIFGQNLDNLANPQDVINQDPTDSNESGPTAFVFYIDRTKASSPQNVILSCTQNDVPVSLSVPSQSSPNGNGTPGAASGATAKPNPTNSAPVGASTIPIGGTHLEQVVSVIWSGKPLDFMLDPYDANNGVTSLRIDVSKFPDILKTVGVKVPLLLHLIDNSYLSLNVDVVAAAAPRQ